MKGLNEQLPIEAVFPKVFRKETVAMTNTLKVAEYFGKQHKNILQRLENLECSEEFNRLNFKPVKYTDQKGESRKMFLMTQDGFTLLVMGFTGKKAMQFKEMYIAEFNRMKKQLDSKDRLRDTQHLLNEAIDFKQQTSEKEDPHAYSRENTLVYCVALGMSKKKWLLQNGYPADVEIRQFLTPEQLDLIHLLVTENATMIKLGLEYTVRKNHLQASALHYWRKLAVGKNQNVSG